MASTHGAHSLRLAYAIPCSLARPPSPRRAALRTQDEIWTFLDGIARNDAPQRAEATARRLLHVAAQCLDLTLTPDAPAAARSALEEAIERHFVAPLRAAYAGQADSVPVQVGKGHSSARQGGGGEGGAAHSNGEAAWASCKPMLGTAFGHRRICSTRVGLVHPSSPPPAPFLTRLLFSLYAAAFCPAPQKMKTCIREFEHENLWGYFGWNRAWSVSALGFSNLSLVMPVALRLPHWFVAVGGKAPKTNASSSLPWFLPASLLSIRHPPPSVHHLRLPFYLAGTPSAQQAPTPPTAQAGVPAVVAPLRALMERVCPSLVTSAFDPTDGLPDTRANRSPTPATHQRFCSCCCSHVGRFFGEAGRSEGQGDSLRCLCWRSVEACPFPAFHFPPSPPTAARGVRPRTHLLTLFARSKLSPTLPSAI